MNYHSSTVHTTLLLYCSLLLLHLLDGAILQKLLLKYYTKFFTNIFQHSCTGTYHYINKKNFGCQNFYAEENFLELDNARNLMLSCARGRLSYHLIKAS